MTHTMNPHVLFSKRKDILDYIVIFLKLQEKYAPLWKKMFVRTEVRWKEVTVTKIYMIILTLQYFQVPIKNILHHSITR